MGLKHLGNSSPIVLPIILLLKFGYAFFFLFIYTEYYGGGELTADAGRFFEESKILHDVFWQSPSDFFQFLFGLNNDSKFINEYLSATNHWNAGAQFLLNDSRNVMRANALLLFISNGSVYIHFVIFSFISFLGAFDLYQFIRKSSTIPQNLLLFVVILSPSIAFWSSSIIKEPLLITGLFIFIRGVFDQLSLRQRSWRIMLGGLLLVGFKPYVFIAVLVGISFYTFSQFIKLNRAVQLLSFIALISAGLYFSGGLKTMTHVISKQQEDFMNLRDGGLYLEAEPYYYYYVYYENRSKFEINGKQAVLKDTIGAMRLPIADNFDRSPVNLVNVGDTFQVAVQLSKAGSGFEITPIRDDFSTMLRMIPEVLFNTYIRPVPGKNKTWLTIPAFIENIIYILGLLFAFIIFPRKLSRSLNNVLWSLLIIGGIITLIVGWTTPVAGAIVRYIIPAQAMILIIILIRIDWNRLARYYTKS